MSVPISFPSTTANYSLPLLFTGQAQKEFSLNQSLSIIDAMLTPTVSASLSTPPTNAAEGECFRVAAPTDGEWLAHDNDIAIRLGGAWQFVQPQDGLTVFDRLDGAFWHFNSGWKSASEPAAPTGGSVIDSEVRAALSELIQALRNLGVFSDLS